MHSEVIYIIDDDVSIRDSLSVVFMLEGFTPVTFPDGDSFLTDIQEMEPAVVLMDVHMPGKSGIEVLRQLISARYAAPVFIISGQGDISMAVQAIKMGAIDFIEKPFTADTVVNSVCEALSALRSQPREHSFGSFPGMEKLTTRETDVLQQIVSGSSNKEAARALGISPRTIEVHRARIMEKLDARNSAELVRAVFNIGNI